MGFKWQVAPTDVFPQNTDKYIKTVMTTGNRVAEERAQEATQWMKDNAPWEDDTGRARAGLHVDVNQGPAVLAELVFSHDTSLDYPIWLEIAHGGRYGIISQAIDHWGPILMRDMQRIMNLGLASR